MSEEKKCELCSELLVGPDQELYGLAIDVSGEIKFQAKRLLGVAEPLYFYPESGNSLSTEATNGLGETLQNEARKLLKLSEMIDKATEAERAKRFGGK